MQCKKCNFETDRENLKFCPNCGSSFDENVQASNVETPTPNTTVQPQATGSNQLPNLNIKLTKKTVIGLVSIVAAVLVIVGGVFAYKQLTKPLSAEKVVENFFEALKGQDYTKAFGYIDDSNLIGEKFLTAEDFKTMISEVKVTDYRINKDQSDSNSSNDDNDFVPSSKQIDVSIATSDGNEQTNVKVVNTGNNDKPEWKISTDEMITSTSVRALNGLTVEIGGKKLENPEGDGDTGVYHVKMFENAKYKMKIYSDDVEPIEEDINAGDSKEYYEMVPSSQVKDKIKELINNYIAADKKAHDAFDSSFYKPYVLTGSQLDQDLSSYYSGTNQPNSYKMTSMEFGDFKFTSNMKTIYAVTTEVWSSDEYGESNYAMGYSAEKQDDGSWMLTDVGEGN